MTRERRDSRRSLPLAALSMFVTMVVAVAVRTTPRNGVIAEGVYCAYAQSRSGLPLEPPHEANAAPQMNLPESMKDKQRKELRKYRFTKMKEHGDELAKLAKSLQEDLNKSNENILSLEVVDKAQKIEKLAKKIQEEAKFGS